MTVAIASLVHDHPFVRYIIGGFVALGICLGLLGWGLIRREEREKNKKK